MGVSIMTLDNIQYSSIRKKIKDNFFINYDKIPKSYIYIYKITNMTSDKSYIGKTHNIKNRLSQYILWYIKKIPKRFIIENMINDGIEKYRMEIIDTADTDEEGINKEVFYINKFDCVKNGYNRNNLSTYQKHKYRNGNYGHKHTAETKTKKSKFIAAVNLCTNEIILSTGMKLLGDYLGGIPKDLISHAKNRCGSIYNFYIISIDPDDNLKQLHHIQKLLNKKSKQQKLINKCNDFMYALKVVDDTLKNELLNSEFKYSVITQSNNEDGYDKIGMNIVYEYFKLMDKHGSDNG
jgi:hypothetical protein